MEVSPGYLWRITAAPQPRKSGFGKRLEGGADCLGERQPRREVPGSSEGLFFAVTECDQGIQHIGGFLRSRGSGKRPKLALELEHQALGGLLADARDLGEAHRILQRDRL